MKEHTRDLLLMLVIGAGLGVIGVYYWDNKAARPVADDSQLTTPSGATTSDALLVAPPKAESLQHVELPLPPVIPDNSRSGLNVVDQQAGDTVTVTDLSVTGSQWIAIYDERDGKPSWILGAGRVREGDTVSVVHLLRSTESGGTYYAAILNDDGDEEFNRLTDLPPLSPDKVVVVKFKAL